LKRYNQNSTEERNQNCGRDTISMNTDKALATLKIPWILRCGDTGKGKVERMSFLVLRFTQNVRNTFLRKRDKAIILRFLEGLHNE
jgi:hypothetical protein